MEDYKTMKDIVNFGITIVLLLLICLLVYKFGKSVDAKRELYFKESELTDLKIKNEKKNSRLYDIAIQKGEAENGQQ